MKKYKLKYDNKEYSRIWWTIKHFYHGIITYKYPLCCVLNFCKDSVRNILPAITRAKQMNMQFNNFCDKLRPKYKYVPCLNCAEKLLKRKRK